MKKLKLSLYIGLPLFWMMLFLLEQELHYPYVLNIFVGIFNFVPVFIILFIVELFMIYRVEDIGGSVGLLVGSLIFIVPHIAFWLPVAHYINKLWERHERSKKNRRL
ncbi:MAG: hypothetical protein D9C04_04495 [Nitrosopumilus sp. B06]|nr:MAG: hypothetical protein EB828_00495 [Nitrosopumilus sp. D6]RNJ79477.1 MAG: hypothetical protein D9C04_04495 [Nitrosopumilus sp. B06]